MSKPNIFMKYRNEHHKTVMVFFQYLVISMEFGLQFHQPLSLFKISDKASVASVAHAQLAATPAPP